MSPLIFLVRCKFIVNDCTRRLLEDERTSELYQSTFRRMEVLRMSLEWARGALISEEAADEILCLIADYVRGVERASQAAPQGNYDYQAPLVWGGRARYSITAEQLSFMHSVGFTAREIADILNVSVRSVNCRLREFNLSRVSTFSDMQDADLDGIVRDFVGGNDLIGPESVKASLRSIGLNVQIRRIRESMLRINPGASALRALSLRPERQVFHVAGPNSLWHIGGNHKLIRWRIIIHGGIDDYSRVVVFLRASNNNRSSTVLDSFAEAIVRYGIPSHVKTVGGENTDVALSSGPQRDSVLQGRSVRSQRILRLWSDVWRGVTNVYYSLFTRLENEGIINIHNESHLWALHYVYLPRINRDLSDFENQWNHHGLRTERHMTPLQIYVRGCLQQQGRGSTALQDLFPAAAAAPAMAAAAPAAAAAAPAAAAAAPAMAAATPAAGAPDLASLLDWPATVVLPDAQHNLDDAILQQVQMQFDPLGGSRSELGIQILRDVISFLDSVVQ